MPILPGKTIGILGGGQLGRMFAIAARRMGYRVHALDPTNDCPTGQVADVEINAAYDDVEAAEKFARGVDVVTFEFENVPAQTLTAIQRLRPVHPSPQVLDTCRHRLHEKDFLSRRAFPVTQYRAVNGVEQLASAVHELGSKSILKGADFGYDGKGQVRIEHAENLEKAWRTMGRPVGVLEALVPFDKEISVICARTINGQTSCFEPGENVHVRGILDITSVPADISPRLRLAAIELATAITESLDVVGLLAVEMFVVRENLLINELAPRPHNSGHFSFDACATSQFEQQLRAVCGLPLGDATLFSPAAMANLLGDLWRDGEPDWSRALRADPRIKLHLYGKHTALPGRKMGHLTAIAPWAAEARRIAMQARSALLDERRVHP